MEAPPKRGRGRPRKIKYEPEELVFTNDQVDLSDIPPAHAPREPEIVHDSEEEVIHMPGDGTSADRAEEVVAAVPEPVVEKSEAPVTVAPTIVYLPPPPVVDTEKDEKMRRNVALQKIKRYRENFEAVRAMKFSEDWSTDALESHLEDIRIMISSKTSLMLVKSAYTLGVKCAEVGTCAIGMKTYGLSDLLSKNAEIDAILKEIQCEIGIGNLPAHTRLALATISTVFVLDSVNKRAEVLSAFKGEVVADSITAKYGDL